MWNNLRPAHVNIADLIGRDAMDWNRVEGNWKELQQRYGYAKDKAKEDVDTWFSTLK
jgi:uncharacterized protein YjbJ (UPF0337 family)